MYIEKSSLDDIIRELLEKILGSGTLVTNSKGANKEILGVSIKLTNPLNRISASLNKNVFISPFGEFLWYVSGSDELDFIEYYISKYKSFSNNKKTLNGAYGFRLFNKSETGLSQIDTIINLLKQKKNTRQAVVQLFDKNDLLISENKDIPCTCTLQFFIRENKLILFVSMRSNDVFVGLPHDVFCFTMLQELISKELRCELGDYNHFITSCHIYDRDFRKAEQYLEEGYQTTKPLMTPMPVNTSLSLITDILKIENQIRYGHDIDFSTLNIDSYWKDLLKILKIYNSRKTSRPIVEIRDISNQIENENYKYYLKEKYGI